jgi:hypothetical protein
MEDYFCVGDFIMSMIIQKLILRMYESCIVSFCYQKLVIGINSKTKTSKGLIVYYKTNGITSIKNMWMHNTLLLLKCFKKK